MSRNPINLGLANDRHSLPPRGTLGVCRGHAL
jgi:hypothetical protein